MPLRSAYKGRSPGPRRSPALWTLQGVPVLGETLRQARREKGWSVAQLSKRSGVPERLIHEIEGESHTYVPSEANTALLAETLRLPVGLLLEERERLLERWKH